MITLAVRDAVTLFVALTVALAVTLSRLRSRCLAVMRCAVTLDAALAVALYLNANHHKLLLVHCQ